MASVVLSLVGLPSAVLFGALLGGMAHALTSPTPLAVPGIAFKVAQGLVGVTVGTLVSLSALEQIGRDLPIVVAVTVGTIALSLLAGRLLALRRDVSPLTGAFSMIAGGASGVVATARDLGADERVVTVVQYLRVVVVLVTLPFVTAVVFRPESGQGVVGASDAGLGADLLCVALALGVGLPLAARVPVPTATLLLPLVAAAVITASGVLGPVAVPTAVQWVAYALIGAQVGLRFTRDSLRSIARMLPVVLALIVALLVACALMGAALAWLTPVDGLTAYLATTPGGLFAVLAAAADSGSEITFVMALQLVRLLAILALTPALAAWLRRRA
ncbi:MAG: hypothetical protein CMH83_02340 [Nocardioides sp.]|nr:hypothetical protein [Nocardioides sp.]